MTTIKTSAGKEYGYVPGNHYHNVEITITDKDEFTVTVTETWGSCQGQDYYEENGRTEVDAYGEDLETALERAKRDAIDASIEKSYLLQALTQARREYKEQLTEKA